jgi:hypothetical protein
VGRCMGNATGVHEESHPSREDQVERLRPELMVDKHPQGRWDDCQLGVAGSLASLRVGRPTGKSSVWECRSWAVKSPEPAGSPPSTVIGISAAIYCHELNFMRCYVLRFQYTCGIFACLSLRRALRRSPTAFAFVPRKKLW